jgi:hypothetical protein
MSGTEFYSPLDASERILANGRPLAPQEFVKLSDEEMKDPHNARLISEGKLLEVVKVERTQAELQAQAAELKIDGRSNMSKSQLKEAIDAKLASDAHIATARQEAEEANQ